MQTFILSPDALSYFPYQDLDRLRLGKQRVEAKQILIANLHLEDPDKTPFYDRVRKHPVARAWNGFSHSLAVYGLAICSVWLSRGYKDTTHIFFKEVTQSCVNVSSASPWWIKPQVVKFYRALLYAKAPKLYPQWKNVTAPFGIDVLTKGATTQMLQNVGAIL